MRETRTPEELRKVVGDTPALEPKELREFVRSELREIAFFEGALMDPESSPERRRWAIAHLRGHQARLASMTMKSPEIVAEVEAETRAKGTAKGREAVTAKKAERDRIIDTVLIAGKGKRMNVLRRSVNAALKEAGYDVDNKDKKKREAASEGYLYKRQASLGLSKRQQKLSV